MNHDDATAKVSVLGVEINREVWKQVPHLEGSGPDDGVFEVQTEPDGTTVITFGDGEHGRRPPAGDSTIRVSYSLGAGANESVINSTWDFTGKKVHIPLKTQILHSNDVIRIEVSRPSRGCLHSLFSGLRIRTY